MKFYQFAQALFITLTYVKAELGVNSYIQRWSGGNINEGDQEFIRVLNYVKNNVKLNKEVCNPLNLPGNPNKYMCFKIESIKPIVDFATNVYARAYCERGEMCDVALDYTKITTDYLPRFNKETWLTTPELESIIYNEPIAFAPDSLTKPLVIYGPAKVQLQISPILLEVNGTKRLTPKIPDMPYKPVYESFSHKVPVKTPNGLWSFLAAVSPDY